MTFLKFTKMNKVLKNQYYIYFLKRNILYFGICIYKKLKSIKIQQHKIIPIYYKIVFNS